MAREDRNFDWGELQEPSPEATTAPRRRLRLVLALFVATLAGIFARAVQLELADGANFRRLAAEPLVKRVAIPAPRGQILARDGTALAADALARGVAVEYRYLQQSPDTKWLRRQARLRLPVAERKQRERVAAMEMTIRGELDDLHARLARLCGVPREQWLARARRIDRRILELAGRVDERRLERYQQLAGDDEPPSALTAGSILAGLFAPPDRLPPAPVVLVEQLAAHRIADDVSSDVVAEISANQASYPGVRIVEYTRRAYPNGSLAAHLVGHLGPQEETTAGESPAMVRVGAMGIEARFESRLAGKNGNETQFTDRRGNVLGTGQRREALPGGDVVLSIDPQLQRAAESFVDRAVGGPEAARTAGAGADGGAIVVLDVHSGDVLAAASAPRFDPNWFAAGDPRVAAVLADTRRPLFDRALRMAIPPGSAFKPLTAVALLEHDVVKPDDVFDCQGFLEEPQRFRCQIYRHTGVGHGDVTLADALAQSCNVYFFHHVAELGGARLADWAGRFGFGAPVGGSDSSGAEWAGQAAGRLPTAAQLRSPGEARNFAVGQGVLTVTPLELARFYAAIANGGYLVKPRLVRDAIDTASPGERNSPAEQLSESDRVVGLHGETLDAVRDGLRRVVDDARGTAYQSARLSSVAIAGKTGTAETGGQSRDHAWFAGYAPADKPRLAFVVVLEHAGSEGAAAAAVAKKLVERMRQLGYFGAPQSAEKLFPAGKG